MTTADLFGAFDDAGLPPGLRYEPQLITPEEAARLVESISDLPFEAFQFHGFTGKRRVVSFGWKYDFTAQRQSRARAGPYAVPMTCPGCA